MTAITTQSVNQFLTFEMAGDRYALRVTHVSEVLTVPKITKIPRMPEFMKGVINLRGAVVPILDLKQKFGMGDTAITDDTAVIVVEISFDGNEGERQNLRLGIFADSVQKVIAIAENEIEPAPQIGSKINSSFIEGMGHVEDDFIVLLNITEVLTTEDLEFVESAK